MAKKRAAFAFNADGKKRLIRIGGTENRLGSGFEGYVSRVPVELRRSKRTKQRFFALKSFHKPKQPIAEQVNIINQLRKTSEIKKHIPPTYELVVKKVPSPYRNEKPKPENFILMTDLTFGGLFKAVRTFEWKTEQVSSVHYARRAIPTPFFNREQVDLQIKKIQDAALKNGIVINEDAFVAQCTELPDGRLNVVKLWVCDAGCVWKPDPDTLQKLLKEHGL